jgi:hypothetical protein
MKKSFGYFLTVTIVILFAFLILFDFEMFKMTGEKTSVNKIEKYNKLK